jgi:hypothetical protein
MHQPLAYVQFEWLNLNLALARERFPNREPCGEFFPCAGFALDQNRGIRRSNLFHLVQHRQQGRAVAGDFFEVVVGANFLLQINVFLFQAGLQSLDFLVGHHVGDGQRHLIGHFLQKLHVSFGVLALLPAAALDPIVKCTYVVVYQHLRSRREGDDLRGLLAILPREQQKKAEIIASTGTVRSVKIGAAVVVAAVLLGACQATSARAAQAPATQSSTQTSADSAQPANVQKLRQALDEESRREIYRWHDADHPTPPTWLDRCSPRSGMPFNALGPHSGTSFAGCGRAG